MQPVIGVRLDLKNIIQLEKQMRKICVKGEIYEIKSTIPNNL